MKALKSLLIFFLIALCCSIGVSQTNLVINPSFEDTTYCVTGSGEMQAALGWEAYTDSPDYFNVCTSNGDVSVPNNWGGYQQPVSGNAYCALGTYSSAFGGVNVREFIGGALSS